ncbi:MAG: hypothetical protein SV377_02330 [Halobacteria archaeon]|nr:hypothetical protein [Halobacteria archaeon]
MVFHGEMGPLDYVVVGTFVVVGLILILLAWRMVREFKKGIRQGRQ